MRNRLILVAVAVTIVVSVISAVMWNNYQADYQAKKKLQQEQRERLATGLDLLIESYKSGKVDVIDIATITPFKWEKLYLFGPYSTEEDINRITGLKSADSLDTEIYDHDGIVLFVFVNENKVVQYMDYPRNPDFYLLARESGYSPSEAIFLLNEKGEAILNSP